jgi:hypothetical protein
MDDWDELPEIPADVERILHKQDEALALLGRLRVEEPYLKPPTDRKGGKREFRRWPIPEGVLLEMHDGERWQRADCMDIGVGGARLSRLPGFVDGPVPARLTAPRAQSVLVLADTMWKEGNAGRAGIRFEFQDDDERETWSGGLIDALLARHAV